MRWQTYPYRGEMLSAPEIARRAGLATSTVRSRLKAGMKPEEAAATPPWRGKQHLYHGEMLTVKEIAARANIDPKVLGARLHRGYCTAEEAVRRARLLDGERQESAKKTKAGDSAGDCGGADRYDRQ